LSRIGVTPPGVHRRGQDAIGGFRERGVFVLVEAVELGARGVEHDQVLQAADHGAAAVGVGVDEHRAHPRPPRTKECRLSAPGMRSHAYSSTAIRAWPMYGQVLRKWRVSSSANSSAVATPCCLASA